MNTCTDEMLCPEMLTKEFAVWALTLRTLIKQFIEIYNPVRIRRFSLPEGPSSPYIVSKFCSGWSSRLQHCAIGWKCSQLWPFGKQRLYCWKNVSTLCKLCPHNRIINNNQSYELKNSIISTITPRTGRTWHFDKICSKNL